VTRYLWILIILLGVLLECNIAVAQTSGAGESMAAGLDVRVTCSNALGDDAIPGAAVIVGSRGDSLFAVTANHVVRPLDSRCRFQYGFLVSYDPVGVVGFSLSPEFDVAHDIALLVAIIPNSKRSLLNRSRIRGLPVKNPSDLFIFGCPASGSCWDSPLKARVRQFDSTEIRVQSLVIEEGYSGGAVVDNSGILVGMLTGYSGLEGSIVPWSTIERWLTQKGISENFPIAWIDVLSSLMVSVAISGIHPARDSHGKDLIRGWQVTAEHWNEDGVGWIAGINHISLADTLVCQICPDRRTMRGIDGLVGGFGLGYSPRNRGFLLFSNVRVSPTVSARALAGKTQLLASRIGERVDYSSGLGIDEYYTVKQLVVTGWGAVLGADIRLSTHWGARFSFERTILSGFDTSFGTGTLSSRAYSFGMTYRLLN